MNFKIKLTTRHCASIFSAFILLSPITVNAGATIPDGAAAAMLNKYQDGKPLRYQNALYWIEYGSRVPTLGEIKKEVVENGGRYLIDFSLIKNAAQQQKAKALLREQIGIALPGAMLAVTNFNGKLLFTPLENTLDPAAVVLNNQSLMPKLRQAMNSQEEPSHSYTFFIGSSKQFDPSKFCNFLRSPESPSHGYRVMCDGSPFLDVKYQVTYQRSFKYGSTSDRKIVRISVANGNEGAGIKINSALGNGYVETYRRWDGIYHGAFSTNASARNYSVDIETNDNKLQIITLQPRNANPSADISVTNQISVGVSTTTDPYIPITVNATKSQSRSISYKTHEFNYQLSTPNPRKAVFSWNRTLNSSPNSLLKFRESGKHQYPVDTSKITPIAYSNFTPYLDVAYEAPHDYLGISRVMIKSTANIAPYYHTANNRSVFTHLYDGIDHRDQQKTLENFVNLDVDWNHPAFTGTTPVMLRFGSANNACLDAEGPATLKMKSCDEKGNAQAFIYDQNKRYESLRFRGRCLTDSNGYLALSVCDNSNIQKWEWVMNPNKLKNNHSNRYIGHNTSGGFGMVESVNTQYPSLLMSTNYSSHGFN
ncbi:leukocidin family pore-forming toxin (plasmid) [Chromobacterium amazonense]|uniref:leukocidin family pore-forming toxin n=1 Tax=Chromobacterium amazonense TaxID=1382803 RepID=UPI00237E1638|nr:leukocidin family pore-forming toxin [Chromobacterium amazonense]MDE1714904.1 leukocidin family pore-forming toxin [Chromobacterium amazonense]